MAHSTYIFLNTIYSKVRINSTLFKGLTARYLSLIPLNLANTSVLTSLVQVFVWSVAHWWFSASHSFGIYNIYVSTKQVQQSPATFLNEDTQW